MTLLLEMAQAKAASNRRVALSVGATSRRLGSLADLKTELAAWRRTIGLEARAAQRFVIVAAQEMREMWRNVREFFEEGIEGGEGKELLQSVLDLGETWQGMAQSVREFLLIVQDAGVVLEEPGALDAAESEVRGDVAAAAKLMTLLTCPRPPIDPAVLAERARRAKAGQVKRPEEVLARLPKPQE